MVDSTGDSSSSSSTTTTTTTTTTPLPSPSPSPSSVSTRAFEATVGAAVRVRPFHDDEGPGGTSVRALVLTVDAAQGTAEVLARTQPERELCVPLATLRDLEGFEKVAAAAEEEAAAAVDVPPPASPVQEGCGSPEGGDVAGGVAGGQAGGSAAACVAAAVARAERRKAEARALFALKDYRAAAEWYTHAQRHLAVAFSWRSAGEDAAVVLTRVQPGNRLRAASVLAIKGAGWPPRTDPGGGSGEEVLLVSFLGSGGCGDNDDGGGGGGDGGDAGSGDDDDDDDLDTVNARDVVATVVPPCHRPLQCALYLNLARCDLLLGAPQRAAWRATCVLAIGGLPRRQPPSGRRSDGSGSGGGGGDVGAPDVSAQDAKEAVEEAAKEESAAWAATRGTAHLLRAKAHHALLVRGGGRGFSAQACLVRARRDAAAAAALKPSLQKEVVRLARDLAARERALLRADRNLARQIGAWTEAAMEKQAEVERRREREHGEL